MPLRTAKLTLQASLDYAAYLFGTHKRTPKQPALWILMYHRILPKTDPRYAAEEPGMVVEPHTFEMHLEVLQRHFTLIPLGEWLSRRRNGQSLPPKSCALTFDDGWTDNYEYAFPILKRYKAPATLFAVSHMIGTNEMFWPNRLALLLRQPREYLTTLPWLAPHLEVSNGRPIDREAAAAIIQAMKAYPDNQIQEWLESTQTDQTAPSTLMSWEQLKEMSASGLVEVGSHTCHHFRLTQDLPAAVIQRELEESKSRLEAGLGKSISLFCYPNGDLCDLALQTIPLHYDAAVTTQRGINREPSINPYKLLRIGVHQDRCNTAVKFCSRLADWY